MYEQPFRFTLHLHVGSPICPASLSDAFDWVQLQQNKLTVVVTAGPTQDLVVDCEYLAVVPAVGAIANALSDVRTRLPDAKLVRVTPDLVTFPQVAKMADLSDIRLQELRRKSGDEFPQAQAGGRYHLAVMLRWLVERGRMDCRDPRVEVAYATLAMNAALVLAAPMQGVSLPVFV